MREIKIGITMRETEASKYIEARDTIARDWSNFMLEEFKFTKWMFIPNIKKDVIDYVETWGLNLLIFSGGDNLGVYPERDETERILLTYAIEKRIPIIGVCRGLQLIYDYYGGRLKIGDKLFKNTHQSAIHKISTKNGIQTVNSYHANYLEEKSLPKELKVIARSEKDGSIEAVSNERILGIMWHPERNGNTKWSRKLVKEFIQNDNIQ